jgi:molybdenum cofactor cytidylyltransferase
MGHSLACGAQHVPTPAALLVALGDMPAIRTETVRRVRRALADGAAIAVPTHQGRRGHPVGFAAAVQAELGRLHGDQGARAVLQQHAARVQEIPVDDTGILCDVDTPADLSAVADGELSATSPPAG